MKVKELIRELKKFDPNLEVFNRLWHDDCSDCWTNCSPTGHGVPCESAWDIPEPQMEEFFLDEDGFVQYEQDPDLPKLKPVKAVILFPFYMSMQKER